MVRPFPPCCLVAFHGTACGRVTAIHRSSGLRHWIPQRGLRLRLHGIARAVAARIGTCDRVHGAGSCGRRLPLSVMVMAAPVAARACLCIRGRGAGPCGLVLPRLLAAAVVMTVQLL